MKRSFATLLAILSLSAGAEVTLNTEWQDVPDTTKVGAVLNLAPYNATNAAEKVVAEYDRTNLTARIAAKYEKPSGGIPMTDLKGDVQQTIYGKQDALVSGTNIRTINGQSLLGSGNLVIQGGGGTTDYSRLTNKPKIGGVELSGNRTLAEIGAQERIADYTTTNAVESLIAINSITDVRTNGASAVAGGVARIVVPSTNGLASAGDVATAKAQAIAAASADATAKADAAEANAKAASLHSGINYILDPEKLVFNFGSGGSFDMGMSRTGFGWGHFLMGGIGSKWYYLREDGSAYPAPADNEIATLGDLPTPATPAFANAFAEKATEGRVTVISNRLDELTGYITGERVRLSITNYYGNTSGEPPRLRIEEFDHSTTSVVANVAVISNFYRIVWDEVTRQTNYMAVTDAKVDAISNNVMTAAFRQTNLQLANKAPRAWQTVTSAGEAAPNNMVWHTAPNTVFAGGTEYAHVAVGEGTICVLVDKGAPVYTEGAEGQFKFKDESGQNYFGFDVRQSYTIGCRTDGISVDPSTHIVSLTYDLTSEDNPEVLVCTNLTDASWSVATVEWEQSPPVGTKICYINCGTNPQGFYKAQMSYAGGAKFITNMMADLVGGIAATNETTLSTASQLPIYPAITPTGVVWRVNWGN